MSTKPSRPNEAGQAWRISGVRLKPGERIPADGLPLDVLTLLDRCTPDQREQVRALIEEMIGDGPIAYSEADLERLRALLRSFLSQP